MNPTEDRKPVARSEVSNSSQIVIGNGARHGKDSWIAITKLIILIYFCNTPLNIGVCTLKDKLN